MDSQEEAGGKTEMGNNIQSIYRSFGRSPLAFIAFITGVAVVSPAVMYSIYLRPKDPEEVIMAGAVAVFSVTIYLWILDLIGFINFRNSATRASVYSVAIVVILGSCATLVKNRLTKAPFPYAGMWNFHMTYTYWDAETKSWHTLTPRLEVGIVVLREEICVRWQFNSLILYEGR